MEFASSSTPGTARAGTGPVEEQGYLPGGAADELIYYVHHRAEGARARGRGAVLLVGPLALERVHGHLVWVRWARHLARRGFDVLRFDYRGVGESTGELAEMTMTAFVDDVERALAFLGELHPGAPILLHGLRAGALFAARVFAGGRGGGLLLWEPPLSGRAMLLDTLRHKLAGDLAQGTLGARKTRDDYVADLERGQRVEVDGYLWSRELWRSSLDFPLALPGAGEPRPSLIVHLDGRPRDGRVAVQIPKPVFWGDSRWLTPDLGDLFTQSTGFLERA